MSIRLLESHVVDQIAAGEVVERPASVVRELVENALDAGATAIDVRLEDGGRGLVRVADDGVGMDRDDALMSIERHATSKIRTFEDLATAGTLGFRGEALPSIAAVSRFELVTRTRDADEGTRVRVDAGTLTDVKPVGAAPGTVISARSLFHALPARRAFLRSAPTELSHCVETVSRLALGRPDVAFTLTHDGREVLRADRTRSATERAGDVLGDDGRKLVPVRASADELELVGLCAPPGVHRGSAAGATYLYVNGRWVRDPVLRRAIVLAYRDRVPPGRYPLVVLDLRIPPGSVDVNVHPTKAEVRFRDPGRVAAFVEDGLRAVLPGGAPVAAAEARALPFALTPPEPAAPVRGPAAAPFAARPPLAAEPPGLQLRGEPRREPAPAGAGPRIVGTAHQRYWLVEEPGAIVVIDAGRLARRVRVELDVGEPRRLLVPQRVAVPAVIASKVEERAEALAALGLVVGRFSASEVVVRAVPECVADVDPAEVLRIALATDDPRGAWAERAPHAPVPDGLAELAHQLALPIGPVVSRVAV